METLDPEYESIDCPHLDFEPPEEVTTEALISELVRFGDPACQMSIVGDQWYHLATKGSIGKRVAAVELDGMEIEGPKYVRTFYALNSEPDDIRQGLWEHYVWWAEKAHEVINTDHTLEPLQYLAQQGIRYFNKYLPLEVDL